jgi:hypothetical protein
MFMRRLNVTDLIERAEARERRQSRLWKYAALFLLGAGFTFLWIFLGGKV